MLAGADPRPGAGGPGLRAQEEGLLGGHARQDLVTDRRVVINRVFFLFLRTNSMLSFVGKKATLMKIIVIELRNSGQTRPSASIILALAGRVRVGWGGCWVTLHNVQPGFSCVAALGPAISRTIFSHYSTI